MRLAFALGFVAALAASVAQAADRKLDDFVGRWVGSGQATQGPVNPTVTQARDSEVIIEKTSDGFKISWTTMSSDVSDGSKSKVKTSVLTFKKGKQPNVYAELKSGDAMAGKKTTWALISGDTLQINQLVISDDGTFDVTVYKRTLKGTEQMHLEFTRFANGSIVRQATLSMTKAK
jgi:hypothetical protein